MMPTQRSVNSDWLFNTQSRVLLQGDWLMLEHNESVIWDINMPFYCITATLAYYHFNTRCQVQRPLYPLYQCSLHHEYAYALFVVCVCVVCVCVVYVCVVYVCVVYVYVIYVCLVWLCLVWLCVIVHCPTAQCIENSNPRG